MTWGRVALRHAVAVVVALAALLLGGLVPAGPGPPRGAAAQSGPEVAAIQQRLTDLGFWVGPRISGTFDSNTTQALYAFQKLTGLPVTGRADPPTRQKLDSATRPKPASAAGDLIEIDKAHQVLIAVRGGQSQFIFNTSTGTE